MSDNKQEVKRSNAVSFKEPPLPKTSLIIAKYQINHYSNL